MKIRTIGLFLAAVLAAACQKNPAPPGGALNVFVSIPPQRYFVQRVGGERVSVSVMVPPGKNPATYEPLPDQVVALGNADVFFTIGIPFEKAFLPKIEGIMENLLIVDTSSGIRKRKFEGHDHEESGTDDPHIWLSPVLVKIQAKTICETLSRLDPGGEPAYKKGCEELCAELDSLDTHLAQVLAPFRGRKLFVYHPSFGYFADEYGLVQVAIETGGKEPAPALLMEIIESARVEDVKIIFVQPEFSQKSARVIADAIGGAVIVLNPLDPDYINNLKRMAREIEKAF